MARKRSSSSGPARSTSTRRSTPAARQATRSQTAESPVHATIVAVGASAGGLEAFLRLLDRLPKSPNVALLFVQHRPAQESTLPDLLAAKTPLKVVDPTNGTRIEPNVLYVIPPHMAAEVREGCIHLRADARRPVPPLAIDTLFTSLAQWARGRAIGVILSGTGSDGAAGIREIKAQGGITIAQSPETAKYDGMPRAAIKTGLVDLVLSPEEIAEQIAQVRSHPYLAPPSADPDEGADAHVPDAQLREIFAILRRTSGIDFRHYKLPTIKRRLLRRMAVLRLVDVGAYVAYLTEHPNEATTLGQDLLIHVTRFFRDAESFAGLQSIVFPTITQSRQDSDIRVWVPGCATGEEAYSVAICLYEVLGDRAPERRVQIFATDVSESSIEHARLGVFPWSITADVSPERLKRFFSKTDSGYRVAKAIRDMCVFARHDLTRDPPFSRLDLIVCRNVLIYLDVPLQQRLMTVFHYALRTQGFLMLGSAETTGSQGLFTPADKRGRIFRKVPVDVRLPMTSGPPMASDAAHERRAGAGPQPGSPKSMIDDVNRLLLDRYAPAGVVVDGNLHIVQFRGRTGPYLEAAAGEPNLNVLKMARTGLLHPLQTALEAARRRRRAARREHLQVRVNGSWREVEIEVVPLTSGQGDHFLILFLEPAVKPGARKGRRKGARPAEPTGQVTELRRELVANREYLQSIIQELEASNEELQSANEEILSSNEELQSTNEELDTAKEELQSMNEELNTLNEELHSRNEELTQVNSDSRQPARQRRSANRHRRQ